MHVYAYAHVQNLKYIPLKPLHTNLKYIHLKLEFFNFLCYFTHTNFKRLTPCLHYIILYLFTYRCHILDHAPLEASAMYLLILRIQQLLGHKVGLCTAE